MHETSVAQSILSIAAARLRKTPHAKAVRAIHVIIGEFRNVEIESLQFAFDNLKELYDGCAHCELQAEIIQAMAICHNGGHVYSPEFDRSFRCPTCGNGIGSLVSGEALDVIGITLEANSEEEDCRYARVDG